MDPRPLVFAILLILPACRPASNPVRRASSDHPRAQVVAGYQDVLTLAGDPVRGERLFHENCARCHRPQPGRGPIGPPETDLGKGTPAELLTSILHPNGKVEERYLLRIVRLTGGRMADGVLIAESAQAVTLRNEVWDEDLVIRRREIVEIQVSKLSPMPEEIEETISRQGLADLIAYLRQSRP